MNHFRDKLSADEIRVVVAAIKAELDKDRHNKDADALAIFLTLYGVPL